MISQRILFGFIEELCKNDRILKSILGQWKEDKKDGQGILTSSDGARYEGQWKEDKINGQGILSSPDGDHYE